MRIADEHRLAIKALGYTESEARFLYLAATHSGYFVPRHFLNLSGAKWGSRTSHFTNQVESRRHAVWREFPGTGGVYQLCSKEIYSVIGKENLYNRRPHSYDFIRKRLLLLDFIIANQQHDYLETEDQKIGYFCDDLHLPKTCLPTKSIESSSESERVRYFADRYPLFLDSSKPGSGPVITLSFVDPGSISTAGLDRHLKTYRPLLWQLSEFRFLFIASSGMNFARAEQSFASMMATPPGLPENPGMLRYFQLRALWDDKQYDRFSTDEMEFLRERNERFVGTPVDRQYADWRAAQRDVGGHPAGKGEFASRLVRQSLRWQATPGWKRLQGASDRM